MRATLEDLKAMSDGQLKDHWMVGKFPFDLAMCGSCLTQHHPMFSSRCGRHEGISNGVSMLQWGNMEIEKVIRPYLEELYALRLFHANLYIETPAEVAPRVETAEEKTLAESAPSLVAQG